MKCEYCQHIIPIEKFGGYLHYTSTKNSIDNLVDMKVFEIFKKNNYETVYHCKKCGTNWTLAAPDFPVTGYLTQM